MPHLIKRLPVSKLHLHHVKNPVRSMYEMGLNIGVNGTPAIYNAEGDHIGAYMSASGT